MARRWWVFVWWSKCSFIISCFLFMILHWERGLHTQKSIPSVDAFLGNIIFPNSGQHIWVLLQNWYENYLPKRFFANRIGGQTICTIFNCTNMYYLLGYEIYSSLASSVHTPVKVISIAKNIKQTHHAVIVVLEILNIEHFIFYRDAMFTSSSYA